MSDILLPELKEDEEYVVRKKSKTELQLLREERDRLQAELNQLQPPSNEELREFGKLYHPYYEIQIALNSIKDHIKLIEG